MDWITTFILAICAMSTLYQLFGIVMTFRHISIRGRMTGTRGAFIGLIILIVIAICRRQDVMQNPAVFCAILLLLIVFLMIQIGLGADAVYYNGHKVGYGEFDYYHIIRDFRGGFTLRLHTRKDDKNYIILFKEKQRETVLQQLHEKGVRDWDSFKFPNDWKE